VRSVLFASWRGWGTTVAALAVAACTPKIGSDPVPESMQFETTAMPPRVPEPTHVLINPATGHLDFSLAGINVPADCAAAGSLMQAQCEFYKYLQGLDGYPTVTPARTPAPALDPATITAQNVVVVDATAGQPVTDVTLGFDTAAGYLTISPKTGWAVGHWYVLGVRGYANGVKSATGKQVVAPVPYYLLKQDSSLTCGATTADAIPESCPAYQLLLSAPKATPASARGNVLQLETLRASFNQLHATDVLAAAGLPKSELAIYWAFPTHTNPVAEVNPPTGAVPHVMGDRTLSVTVKGAIDPSTLKPTMAGRAGTVTLLDLTALAAENIVAGIPAFDVSYQNGNIVLMTQAPLVAMHQYGLFLTTGITSPDHKPLVPSPVSFLLTARGQVAAGGKSLVSGVGDADAVTLEAGRMALTQLFDDPASQILTGLDRAHLAHVYVFPFGGP
jgi:hypothetical protein